MKTLLYLSFLLIDIIASYPYNGYGHYPQRTVMFGGYYGHPMDTKSYIPQGSMSWATGDTIATNSFVGDQSPYDIGTSAEETTERKTSTSYEEELEVDKSTTKPKRIPKKRPIQNEEEDDDEDLPSSWPFGGSNNGAPNYNAFFPIMFGGGSGLGRKSSGDSNGDGFYPGSATAIANSFSTGKGGVATSHATSFGDPYLSMLFRNGNFNRKGSKPIQEN